MAEEDVNSNMVHYGSNLSKSIARYVLAVDVHELASGFYFAFLIRHMILKLRGWYIEL